MRSKFFLLAVLSMPLAACSWGFESEGDAGVVESDDDGGGGGGGGDLDGGGGGGEPDADLSICDNSTLTYDNFAQGFMDSYCLSCHSNTLSTPQRRGAPDSVNFDTFELVEGQAARVRVRVSENLNMPPNSSTQPSSEERDNLAEWIDCGLAQ